MPVVFLADKATGAVHAFRSGLSEAEELDIFPGYDPSLPAAGYPGPDLVWPQAGDTIYPNAYFAGRSRIPNCWSVTSSPWPGEEDRDMEARRLVATIGLHAPGPSLFLAPWEWTGSPLSSKANGRFRYEPSLQDGLIHSRFPLPDADDKDALCFAVRATPWPGSATELLVLGMRRYGAIEDVYELAIADPRSVCSNTPGDFALDPDLVVTWHRLPRTASGALDDSGPLSSMVNAGVMSPLVTDVQVTEDRVHVLMEGLDGTGPGALNTWWLVTFAKTGSVDSPGLDLLYCLQLETVGLRQELQRLKVSPDGRWICATFAHSAPGMMLLYTPDDEGGGLGAPDVVAGLRYFQNGWQGWFRNEGRFADLSTAYSTSNRGNGGGDPRLPVWPLASSGDLNHLDLPSVILSLPITSSEFFEADGELFLSLNTSPISIWRLDAGIAAGLPSGGCPIAFVGCSASENCQRMRVGWATKEGVFHLGDRGSFAWARCNPIVPDGHCPVRPDPLP